MEATRSDLEDTGNLSCAARALQPAVTAAEPRAPGDETAEEAQARLDAEYLAAAQRRLDEKRAGAAAQVTSIKDAAQARAGRRKTASEPQAAASEPQRDADDTQRDPAFTLVKPGIYSVGYLREEKRQAYGRAVWAVTFKITEGADFGAPLYFWLNALSDRHRPSAGHRMVQAFNLATQRKPARDFWRLRPSNFLANCQFKAVVRTVTTTSTRTSSGKSERLELPESLHHSVIERLLELVAGSPPYLGGGPR